jgi:molybdopterin converting factor small subunit
MIRVVLPAHLRTLARVTGEVALDVASPVTQRAVLDALEARYPHVAGNHSRPCHAQAAAVHPVLCLRAGSVARVG